MEDLAAVQARLLGLSALRGPALISALIGEVISLYEKVGKLEREMTAHRKFQAAKDRWLPLGNVPEPAISLPKSVSIDASQLLHPANGFYHLEFNEKGTPFCWTGPGKEFCFDLFIDRKNGADLDLTVLMCIDVERQKSISLFVDGERVDCAITPHGGSIALKAQLPPRTEDRNTNLVFSVPVVLQSANPADTRLLGVAFSSLVVTAPSSGGAMQRLPGSSESAATGPMESQDAA
jgi:hypothetical protein